MTVVDTKNNLLINRLVKKHFSLNEKSQKLFTQRLLYERPIAKEYAAILKDSKDLRARFDINEDVLEHFDASWGDFKNNFTSYVHSRNIAYSNYFKNKIVINKNEKKILKDIVDFYKEQTKSWLSGKGDFPEDIIEISFSNTQTFIRKMREMVINKIINWYKSSGIDDTNIDFTIRFNKEYTAFDDMFFDLFYNRNFQNISFFLRNYESSYRCVITLADVYSTEKEKDFFLKEMERYIHEISEERIRNRFSSIVEKKPFSSKQLELVFTLNYADWFMASTGDSWTSCISLYSTYDECFWTGLPTLIGDKSRAMVYITEKNGPKKEFYGIKVDKFHVRTWMQLWRSIPTNLDDKINYKNTQTFFSLTKSYPVLINKLETILEKFIPIKSRDTFYGEDVPFQKCVSRYYTENLWFERNCEGNETYSNIYLDEGNFKLAKKNKGKYFPGEYGYYKLISGRYCPRYERNSFNGIQEARNFLGSGISFAEIIDDNSTVSNEYERFLEGYNRNYEEDEDYYDDDYDEDAM